MVRCIMNIQWIMNRQNNVCADKLFSVEKTVISLQFMKK